MSDTGTTPMLRARRLHKEHGSGAGLVRAVDWVDLDVAPLALSGASASGVATARALVSDPLVVPARAATERPVAIAVTS